MKKAVICAVLLSCILCACSARQDSPTAMPDPPISKQEPSEPPDLMIEYIDGDETDEITATMGTYSWHDRGKGIEADSPYPLDMRDMATIADNPEKIRLVFHDDPDGYSVRRWEKGAGYEDFDTVATADDRIVLTEDTAIYIYEIKAEYKNGTVYYAFKIDK